MPLTRAAAARNALPDAPRPAPKCQQKTAGTKCKRTVAPPAGSVDAVAASASLSPHSIDLGCAAHAQILAPSPPSHPPRKIATTYNTRNSNPSNTNRPVPQLRLHGEGHVDSDPDAAFISNCIKRGRDDCGVHLTPLPNSPLDINMTPNYHDHCSPPWVEDVQNDDNELVNPQDHGTPLYFPPSPPNTINHRTQRLTSASPANYSPQTPKSLLSSPSGSDYSEKRNDNEWKHQQRIRL